MSENILKQIIIPALDMLAPCGIPSTIPAQVMLYAIGQQESRLTHRYQVLAGGAKGPARGLWQFEKNGGVKGVLSHKSSAETACHFAAERAGSIDPVLVWEALEEDDILAAVFARLLLWTDSQPLPPAGPKAEDQAWTYYLRTWRPGKPHREFWAKNWATALAAVSGE
jgi:hypothetical protein